MSTEPAHLTTTTLVGGPAPTHPAAVLWDMDGTLIDTEPHWMGAEIALAELHGGTWTPADAIAMIGNPMSVCAAALRARGVDLPDEAISAFLNGRVGAAVAAGIPWQAGAEEALAGLVAAGVPLALVTSSFRELAAPFALAVGVFDVVVSGDEVAHAKPHPEPYLTAAARLGVPVERCVAVEDSPSGIASAVAAGARVLAVQVQAAFEIPAGVSRVTSLADLGPGHLGRIGAGEVLDLRSPQRPGRHRL